MDFFKKSSKLRDFLFITVGAALMAVSIKMVYDPQGLVTGGVSGIGIILKHYTGFPIWATNLILNVPVFVFAFILLGKASTIKSLIANGMLTLFLAVLPDVALFEEDILLSSVFGGIIAGVGIGLIFLTSATSGGTDLFAAILHRKIRHYSIPQMLMVIDGLVITAGLFVFGKEVTMYALITIFISNKLSDSMLEGFKFAKVAFIVTDHGKEIADEVLSKMDRGVTGFDATGMYSGNHKDVLMCAVSKKEIVTLLDIVNKIDPLAFVTVNDAREVCGEGFVENTHLDV